MTESSSYSRQARRYAVRKLWKSVLPVTLGNRGPTGRPDERGNRKQRGFQRYVWGTILPLILMNKRRARA